MPIYEYRCEKCQHQLEAMQKISEEPLRKCPVCKKQALVKLVSAAGFRLKGGGWYETDFKSGSKRNLAAESKGGESKPASDTSGGSGSTSSDSSSKPAASSGAGV